MMATIFFIFSLGYFFFLRHKLEMRENIYLDFLVLEKKLNMQLKMSEGYSSYRGKIENLKNKFDIRIKDRINKLVYPLLSGRLGTPFFDVNKIKILSAENKNFLNSLEVESNLSSSDNNTIINFLYAMNRLEESIFIENFIWNSLNFLPESQKQNIVFLFKIYTTELSNKNLISVLSKIIKLDDKSKQERDSLLKFHLNKIKMVGYLSDNKIKNLGFILLPNKQIFKVQLGDQLGLERGLVIAIYDQQMFILIENFKKIIKFSIGKNKFSYVNNFE